MTKARTVDWKIMLTRACPWATRYVLTLAVLLLGSGCSEKDEPNTMFPFGPTAGMTVGGMGAAAGLSAQGGVQAAGSGVPVGGAGLGASSGGAGAGVGGMTTPAGTGGLGGMGASGVGAGGTGAVAGTMASAGTGAEPDCTPSAWQDPGTVANPEVVAVPADAGTTGELFGESKGIDAYDYLEEEFFFTGTSPAYTSRMVVHRPADPAKFTGTVIMEWYNVTGGIDIAALWATSREYMMREGHVHVGVSAQAVGANALKTYDAERYAAINHPGDTAANAIFAHAAMAIRAQTELLLGPCMPVDTVLGVGQSQSAALLSTYVGSAHPMDQIYDGFMLHSNPFGSPPSDPGAPVFAVSTMNEADGTVTDEPNIVEWEVAGASHNDAHLTARGNEEQGAALGGGVTLQCASPLNDFPSFWVYNAALDWLNRWVREGDRPPAGPPMSVGQFDAHGNVLGGVRIQDIDVPIASYTSANAATNPLDIISALGCGLGGSVVPFTGQELLQLYPTHDDYVQQYTAAADQALANEYLLGADYDIAIQQAMNAPIPN